MPISLHTPEALIGRSDSKDPLTTCCGMTSNGRSCRRSLAASSRSRSSNAGAVATGGIYLDAAALFCWQHQDQARDSDLQRLRLENRRHGGLQQRTSIDTIIDRLGTLNIPMQEVNAPVETGNLKTTNNEDDGNRRKSHSDRNRLSLLAEGGQQTSSAKKKHSRQQPSRSKHQSSLLSFLCCLSVDSTLNEESIRPSRRAQPVKNRDDLQVSSKRSLRPRNYQQAETGSRESTTHRSERGSDVDAEHQSRRPQGRPRIQHGPPSQTGHLLSLIPPSLPPRTAALLLAELAKPVSSTDEEGYIYIYSLNDPSTMNSNRMVADAVNDAGPVSGDISGGGGNQAHHHDRQEDRQTKMGQKKSILLKIGRASNVHRRMNQWKRQCGYELTVIRFYPTTTTTTTAAKSSSSSSSSSSVTKVKHVRRVERLIHLELLSNRVKSACLACGQVHQEWFAVDPHPQCLRAVNQTVLRWVTWAENL